MPAPTKVLLAYGGASSEHEISIRSAQSVLHAMDRHRFEPVLLAIRRDGGWRTAPSDTPLVDVFERGTRVTDLVGLGVDVAFAVLHGPRGEDGCIQGLFELLGLPYVGSGVLASATCMDKSAQKHLVRSLAPQLPLLPWIDVRAAEVASPAAAETLLQRVHSELGFPCFAKPANMGSSVGVHRLEGPEGFAEALRDIARFDDKIVIERGADALEIEVAVLGNGGAETEVSEPAEIVLPPGCWYDYETKYVNQDARLRVPAELPAAVRSTIRGHARRAFEVMGCKGLARIDFLLDQRSGTAFLNELNTMPGFTSISMYPKMMAHAGIDYPSLITRLLELAVQDFERRHGVGVQR